MSGLLYDHDSVQSMCYSSKRHCLGLITTGFRMAP